MSWCLLPRRHLVRTMDTAILASLVMLHLPALQAQGEQGLGGMSHPADNTSVPSPFSPDPPPWRRHLPSGEERLLRDLFTDYHPSARPVLDSANTVMVNIQFSLMHIKVLDVRSQILTTTGLLIVEWQDERLVWNAAHYSNVTELVLESSRIWRPEFAVINGAEKIYENYSNFRAIVTNEGQVRWEPGGVFKTMCQIDITYYPFDEQMCTLMFGAWSYHTSKMNLTNVSSEVNMDSYKPNGEWQILHTVAKRDEFAYTCCPNDKFSYVAFIVYMRRRHTFYIMNVILPSIMTSVLLLSIFFCTPGQKVQIGVVVLLSFRIFLLNVAGDIPKTSDHIPLLGIYLTCTMAITTLSMVLTVFILNLHHITDRPAPRWVRRLVLFYLGRVLGFCRDDKELRAREQKAGIKPKPHALNAFANRKIAKTMAATGGIPSPITWDSKTCDINDLENHNDGDSHPMLKSDKGECTSNPAADNAKEWRQVAEVLDRLFFWLFLMAILITTLILFHPLTDGYLSSASK